MPLLGRQAELNRVLDAFRRVREGAGATVFLEGEPGIGKTRLVDEALAAGASPKVKVARSAAREVEKNRPFGLIADALDLLPSSADPERAGIASLIVGGGLDADRTVDLKAGPSIRYQVVEAILRLAERQALTDPIVLVLEDLHWADPSSVLTVHMLASRLRDLPVGLIATFRPGGSRDRDLDRVVEALEADGADRLVLGPLGATEVAALVTALVGARPGRRLGQQLEGAKGNPLFVLELVRALSEEHALKVSNGAIELERTSLPPTLRLMLLRRFAHVSSDTLDILRVASVLGSTFDVRRLSLVTGRSTADLAPLLHEAIRSFIVSDAGTELAFRHDLIREAMYDDLPAAVRAGLHLDTAWALADAGATPIQVAEHLALGAQPGDRRALQWLHSAARDILALAPASAAGLLERALALVPEPGPSQDALVADLVVASLWSGRLTQAEELARSLLRRAHDPAVGMAVRGALIDVLGLQGRVPEMIHECQLAMTDRGLPGAVRAQLRALSAVGLLYSTDISAATAPAAEARREADEVGDDTAACFALSVSGLAAMMQARAHEAVTYLEDAVVRADRDPSKGSLRSTYSPYCMLGLALVEVDQLRDAERAFHTGLRLSQELGASSNLPLFHWGLAECHFLAGKWDEAVAEAETGFILGDEVGAAMGSAMAHVAVAMISFHRNDLMSAEAQVARAEAVFPDAAPEMIGNWLHWARAMLLEEQGDVCQALRVLERGWERRVAAGVLVDHILLGPHFVRLCLAAGRPEGAGPVIDQVDEAARRLRTPTACGAALRCRGMFEADIDLLIEAVDVLRDGPRRLEFGLACGEAAEALRSTGRTSDAVGIFDQAASVFESIGAVRDLARTEAGLRSCGVRRGRRGPRRPKPTVGWESLTPTEIAVVGLVSRGLTNVEIGRQLFISPRTVECHLSHVFTKLGLGSRAALRAEMAKRDVSPRR